MKRRFYLDSNVFISFVREEIDSAFNLRGVDSENFFALCRKEKHSLLLSELFFTEVEKVISLNKSAILEEFNMLKIKVEIFENSVSKNLISKIIKETGIHFADAVHTAIAIENNASALISWNKKDFMKVHKFVKFLQPNEILEKP